MYGKIVAEQEKCEKVPTCVDGDVHYIPHHAVHKDASATPIRIVYDCSCRQSKHHPSLNDCLMVGPPQQNDICAIMLRFLCHAIGLSTDIEKTFRHVRLNEADRDYARFLWLLNPQDSESDFQSYCFKSVLFGCVYINNVHELLSLYRQQSDVTNKAMTPPKRCTVGDRSYGLQFF